MNETALCWLPTLAAGLHFVQLPSMRVAQRSAVWRQEFQHLSPLIRRLAAVFAGGIVACVVGLALVVMFSHGELLSTAVGRGLCLFLCLFWLARGAAQMTFLVQLWPRSLRWMHWGLVVFYPALGAVYGVAWGLSVWGAP